MTFEQWWDEFNEKQYKGSMTLSQKETARIAFHAAQEACQKESQNDITVIQPGAQASMGGIKVSILSVTIGYSGHTTYTVSWLDGNTRNVATVEEHELVCTSDKAHDNLRIGFNNR